jgi:hypothetical protein
MRLNREVLFRAFVLNEWAVSLRGAWGLSLTPPAVLTLKINNKTLKVAS